jgi:hypothetical protein
MKTVLVATFNEKEPARQVQEQLQHAGVPAAIHDESKVQRFWFMCAPMAAVHVEVSHADYLKAMDLIGQWRQSTNVLHDAVICPACHSSRVEFPQLTRKFVTPTFGGLLIAAGLVPREFYCLDCHYTWPTVLRLEPRLDLLGWPYKSKLWHPENAEPTRHT